MTTPSFWECEDAFDPSELARARELLESRETNNQSFTEVERDGESEWLYQKVLSLAARADTECQWNLLQDSWGATDLIYDRFGPSFSDVEFKWHVDAMETDRTRRVSLVCYFTERIQFEGGVLQIKLPKEGVPSTQGEHLGPGEEIISRRYGPGACVAFPPSSLWHNLTPVSKGERRSMLLIAGGIAGGAAPGMGWGAQPEPG